MLFNRILLTGANGLVGQALVRRMGASADYSVLATGRQEEPSFDGSICDYGFLDVTHPEAVTATFQEFDPNVVINCAACPDVTACEHNREEAWTVNARAVKRIAKQCHETGAQLVQVSSAAVFNGRRGPFDENGRPDPVHYYGRTKLASENAVREAGRTNWAIVRTALPYGTGRDLSHTNPVRRMIDHLSQGSTLQVPEDRHRTPTYADDLAVGIERLIQSEKSGLYHLSGRNVVTLYKFACQVAEVFGFDASLVHPVASESLDEDVDRPSHTGLIISRAETELGYDPRSIDEALHHLKDQLDTMPVS